MPFDSNGKYSLPGGNPVIPGTKISSAWANNTLADMANALSNTLLRRPGSVAPMHLNADAEGFRVKIGVESTILDITNRLKVLEAESAAGIGSIVMCGHQNLALYGSTHLLCDGRAVSRTEYADLFSRVGVVWGIGNGATTFNLPDFRGVVPRGLDMGKGLDNGRAFASYQADDFKAHSHSGSAASAGAHTHPFNGSGSTASAGTHDHSVSGSTSSAGAHTHGTPQGHPFSGTGGGSYASGDDMTTVVIAYPQSQSAGTHTHSISGTAASAGAHTHTVSVSGTVSSAGAHTHTVTVGDTGGSETRMKNVAVLFLIKYRTGGDVQLLNALTNSGGDNLINPLADPLTSGSQF